MTTADATTGYTANANHLSTATTGISSYTNLSAVLGLAEASRSFSEADTVVIAHPSFKGQFRGVVDTQGNPIFVEGLAGTPSSLFGYQVRWSQGARVTATADGTPPVTTGAKGTAGNPLLIVGLAVGAHARCPVRSRVGRHRRPRRCLGADRRDDPEDACPSRLRCRLPRRLRRAGARHRLIPDAVPAGGFDPAPAGQSRISRPQKERHTVAKKDTEGAARGARRRPELVTPPEQPNPEAALEFPRHRARARRRRCRTSPTSRWPRGRRTSRTPRPRPFTARTSSS